MIVTPGAVEPPPRLRSPQGFDELEAWDFLGIDGRFAGRLFFVLNECARFIENRPRSVWISVHGEPEKPEPEHFCRACHVRQFRGVEAMHLDDCPARKARDLLHHVLQVMFADLDAADAPGALAREALIAACQSELPSRTRDFEKRYSRVWFNVL